ncbi:MAG: chemotaxis protein CheD [Clostridia bacterium]|nr:chemotaxis protein CheD [Clostridia bacterium]NCC68556.1 chemotaxis protein CheD [Clostridia bacterium]
MERNSFPVDIAKMKIARSPDRLYSLGLGSCVGVALYDSAARIGGLIHILLPSCEGFEGGSHSRTKFADSGINELVKEMVGQGASRFRLKAKIAGGAAMFAMQSSGPAGSIGVRNVESCKQTLKELGIQLVAQEVGGNKGRTIYFDVETGMLTIRMVDEREKVI